MHINWECIQPIQGELIVVEDDPILRTLMKDMVAEIGALAVVFETADDALTYLLQTHDRCRLVIADYGVPGRIQGIEFIQMVRQKWPEIAVILTSGYLIESTRVPAGAVYLHKPWSLDDLVLAITSLLQPDAPIIKG